MDIGVLEQVANRHIESCGLSAPQVGARKALPSIARVSVSWSRRSWRFLRLFAAPKHRVVCAIHLASRTDLAKKAIKPKMGKAATRQWLLALGQHFTIPHPFLPAADTTPRPCRYSHLQFARTRLQASGSNLTFESRRGFPADSIRASLAHANRNFHHSQAR